MRKILAKIKRAAVGWWENKTEQLTPIHSDLKPLEIGRTVNGQKISCYRIGSGPKKILMLGAVHGNEIGTVKLTHHLINWFDPDQYPNLTVYFIPCLNSDGYQEALQNPDYFGGGRIGRVNANNVDLNRNFDTPSFQTTADWTHGKNYEEKTEVFAGDCVNSEPETQALTELIKSRNIKTVFSFHNAGADIVGNPIPPAPKLAKIFSQIINYRYLTDDDWLKFHQTGSSYEWCTINKIALLEIEASNRYGSDWAKQKPAVEAVLKELSDGK